MHAISLDQDWDLLNYFGHIKVLTMDQSGGRFKRCKEELAKVGLKPGDYEVVLGIDGKTLPQELWQRMVSGDLRRNECPQEFIERRKMGQMGCYMAHYKLI